MTLRACIEEQIGRLVHPAALPSPELAARQRLFFETRLGVGFAALATVPIFLARGGVPSVFHALVLAWLTLPLIAVALLSARGRLGEAELVSASAWAGLAGTLALGGFASAGASASLLLLLPLEATLAESRRATMLAGTVAILEAVVLLLAADLRPAGVGLTEPLFALLGVVYGSMLCVCGTRFRDERRDAARRDQDAGALLFEAVGDLAIRFEGANAQLVNASAAKSRPGLDEHDLTGRGFFERVHVGDRPLFLKLISDGSRGSEEQHGRLRLRTSSQPGREHAFEEPVFADIDLRVRALEAAIALATVRIAPKQDESGTAKPLKPPTTKAVTDGAWSDRFLATVSHELRTPLNAIIGFSEMLANDSHSPRQPEKRREYAEIIYTSGQHLLAVVNSMLDLSKIDAGKFELTPEPFAVGGVLASCCDMMHLKAEQARVNLVWSSEPADLQIVGDQRAVRQIVINLLSNALKFTPAYGQVSIEAHADRETLSVIVTDTGIGMAARDLERLGDPFFQALNADDRRFDGTGLGLSVVSGLVGLHGGTIQAESAPGEGTRLTIRLPRNLRFGPTRIGKARIETVSRPPRLSPAASTPSAKVHKIA